MPVPPTASSNALSGMCSARIGAMENYWALGTMAQLGLILLIDGPYEKQGITHETRSEQGRGAPRHGAVAVNPSILRNMMVAFLAFGLAMGIVFPFYAGFFVEWKPGMKIWFVLGCLVAGTTIGIVNYVLVNTILVRKLRRIAHVANAIASKDLSHHCKIESHDVIGEIVDSFNNMAASLRDMMRELNNASGSIDSSVNEMKQVIDQTHTRVHSQRADIDDTAAWVSDNATAMTAIGSDSEEALSAARQASASAFEGGSVVGATVNRIRELVEKVEHAAGAVDQLEALSARIGEVTGTIVGIAEQTNLLALNASIEAARAGDHGRGFAVVADEVRTLSQRSHKAAGEIQETVEQVRSGISSVAGSIQLSTDVARDTVVTAREAEEVLRVIDGAVEGITERNRQIAEAVREQQRLSQEVAGKVDQLLSEAAHSVAEAERASSAGNTLADVSRHLQGIVAGYRV